MAKFSWDRTAQQAALAAFAPADLSGLSNEELLTRVLYGAASIGPSFGAADVCVGPKALLDKGIAEINKRFSINMPAALPAA